MALGANLGAGLSQEYSASANSGGSINNAMNESYSYNNSWNDAFNTSSNYALANAIAWTNAQEARQWSAKAADTAWERDWKAFETQMDFNRDEAAKQRAFMADMANTIYTRSVKNMKEAGINPILAYRMGLSGAGVSSGSSASLGGSPNAPLAQNFMDSYSASNSMSQGSSYGESHGGSFGESFGTGSSSGSSWNSGWSNSEGGIVTALQALGGMADTALAGINAGNTMDYLNNMAGGNPITKWGESVGQKIKDSVVGGVRKIGNAISDKIDDIKNKGKQTSTYNGGGGGHGFKKQKSF